MLVCAFCGSPEVREEISRDVNTGDEESQCFYCIQCSAETDIVTQEEFDHAGHSALLKSDLPTED